MDTSVSAMGRGGWITFPFIIGSMACLTLAAGGWISNLIVYLIEEFNIKSITAAKIFNFVNGSITMFPIIGAVIADSYLGCFSVIWFSSLISLLGMLLLLLTASINHLSPPSCQTTSPNPCQRPSHLQLGLLYLALALSSLGNAGTRFTIAPMGADQLDREAHRGIFFNWYIFTMYAATVVSSTAIVYVQDNVSWTWGFGLCLAANLLGFLLFLAGRPFYRLARPEGSPFKSLARVLVAAYRKRRMVVSDKVEDYYHDQSSKTAIKDNPTSFFRFLNRAALKSEGDTKQDGSITHQWKLCTVKQVEDLKILIKIFPLWSTGLFLCTPLAIQLSITILQALTMDRRLGPTFTIPAGSMPVFILISTSLSLLLIDRLVSPLSRKLAIGRPLTLLQRVGVGHFLTIVSMAVSAVVESKRRKIANVRTDDVAAMSVLWLVPQLVVAGAGEAFHFPGNIALFYQEFPEALKSTSTAAVAMFIGAAFYMSNGVIDLVRKVSGWVPDDINGGRVDGLYWLCCGLGGLNFGYFLVCASMYKYRSSEESVDDCNDS